MFDENVYIADGVQLSGDIYIAEDCSLWYNAVLRASDESKITVGRGTNIQDGCIFHASNGYNIKVGENVTIGHGAIIHCCEIGDNTIIGMGAIVLTNAVIGSNCVIGAGALVTSGTVIPDGMMAFGSPARVKRPLTDEEIAGNRGSAEHYIAEARDVLGK